MAGQGKRNLRPRLLVLAGVCAIMVLVHLVNMLSGGALSSLGIQPRDPASLYAIVTTPWVHGSLGHLGNNLVMLAALAGLCLLEGVGYFVRASAIIIIVSGLLLWLFGREGVHIGASGWIFGLWSLTIVRAWFQRSYGNVLIAVAVVLLYGGLAWGMLPAGAGISFEGHIFGAMAGVAAAWALHRAASPILRRKGALAFWD